MVQRLQELLTKEKYEEVVDLFNDLESIEDNINFLTDEAYGAKQNQDKEVYLNCECELDELADEQNKTEWALRKIFNGDSWLEYYSNWYD